MTADTSALADTSRSNAASSTESPSPLSRTPVSTGAVGRLGSVRAAHATASARSSCSTRIFMRPPYDAVANPDTRIAVPTTARVCSSPGAVAHRPAVSTHLVMGLRSIGQQGSSSPSVLGTVWISHESCGALARRHPQDLWATPPDLLTTVDNLPESVRLSLGIPNYNRVDPEPMNRWCTCDTCVVHAGKRHADQWWGQCRFVRIGRTRQRYRSCTRVSHSCSRTFSAAAATAATAAIMAADTTGRFTSRV